MIYVQFEMGEVVKKELGVFEQVGVAFNRKKFVFGVGLAGGRRKESGWLEVL